MKLSEAGIPGMEITIRPATITDIPVIEKLIDASVRGLSRDYYTTEQIETALTEIFGVDTQLISDGTNFMAEAGSEVVGCGGWSKRQTLFGSDLLKMGASDPLLDPTTDAARIRAFYVHPSWARRGVGKQILRVGEAAAGSAGFTRLELVATLPGQPLYAAMGYTVLEATLLPLSNGRSLPASRMGKVLTQNFTLNPSVD